MSIAKNDAMKPSNGISRLKPTPSRRRRFRASGFALIVTLMLMVLLVVLAIGMLSLSSIGQRTSMQGKNMVAARANARLAMMVALGDLQKYAGPDQRVTAPAAIGRGLQSPPRPFTRNTHWTGVWSTTAVDATSKIPDPSKPMVGSNTDLAAPSGLAAPDERYLTDRRNIDPNLTNNKWNNNLRLAWLVSGTYSNTASTSNSPAYTNRNPTASTTTINKVKVVGSGTLGATPSDPAGDPVNVPMVGFPPTATAGNERNGFAYWVGDESQKARIDQKASDKQPDASAPANGGMARLAGAEGPNFRTVKAGATTPYAPLQDATAADRAKLVSPGTVGLPATNSDAPKANYYDLTSHSESVLADAREGGLQKDMTAYIHSTDDKGIPAIANISETGLTHVASSYSSNLGVSGKPMLPGPLYETYGPNFVQLRKWYDLRKKTSGSLSSAKMDPQFLPTRALNLAGYPIYGPMPDIKAHAQAVHPLMTDCKMAYDFSIDTTRANGAAVRLHVYPRVTLWNPYNITLNGQKYLVGFLKVVGGMSAKPGQAASIPGTNGDFYGDGIPEPMVYFTLNVPDMAPGECLIFSPDTSSESDKFSPSDISRNVLSPAVPSGGLSNFYFDSNRQLPPLNPPNPPAPDDWKDLPYAIHTGETRQFVLKRSGNSAGNTNTSANNEDIIQKLSVNSCGENGTYYAGSVHGNWKQNESMRLLKSSSAHDGAIPSRHWSTEARLQWMDEYRGEMIGAYGGAIGNFPVRKPVIANFNIRPSIAHRGNFDITFEQWYWNYGPYLESIAEQKPLNDPAFRGSYSGKSYGSPFGYASDYSAVKSFVMFDVPTPETPVFSLAAFQHAQLNYQGWQATYAIGNSMCEPRAGSGFDLREPANPMYSRDCPVNLAYIEGYGSGGLQHGGNESTYKIAWDGDFEIDRGTGAGRWTDLIQNSGAVNDMKEIFFYDASFMLNHVLWDRYFLSSIPHGNDGKAIWTDASRILPNTRMVLNPYPSTSVAERTARITGANEHDYNAYYLLNQGAFNVNSTSVEAWRAFLSSMNDVKRPTKNGATVAGAFSRLLLPNTNDPIGRHFTPGPWNSARALTETEIDLLAKEMVNVVKSRGPFLGLADFINRRLVPISTAIPIKGPGIIGTDDTADATLCGPLQAAIEKAGINSTLQDPSITSPSLGGLGVPGGDAGTTDAKRGGWSFDNRSLNPDYWAFAPWKTFGAPGYVTQADILQTIGSNITTRGDTFVIRTYGETRDANNKVSAKAWCEVVVQRTPDYLAAKPLQDASDATGNNPLEPMVTRNANGYTLTSNPKILPINALFGRRFVIKQFRWLDPSEI